MPRLAKKSTSEAITTITDVNYPFIRSEQSRDVVKTAENLHSELNGRRCGSCQLAIVRRSRLAAGAGARMLTSSRTRTNKKSAHPVGVVALNSGNTSGTRNMRGRQSRCTFIFTDADVRGGGGALAIAADD